MNEPAAKDGWGLSRKVEQARIDEVRIPLRELSLISDSVSWDASCVDLFSEGLGVTKPKVDFATIERLKTKNDVQALILKLFE